MPSADEFSFNDEGNGHTVVIYHEGERLCAIHRVATMAEATQRYILEVTLARLANLSYVPKPKQIPEVRAQVRAALKSSRSSRARLNPEFIVKGLSSNDWLTA